MTETENNVKEYLKKYNLEDELSNAVNQAIKLQSDDPYRVISDYLKQFAKEQDDDYDDDDDVMAEGEEPTIRPPAGRRQQVAAKKFEIPEGWVMPKTEKSPEDAKFLADTMDTNKLMKLLSPSDREALAGAFKKETVAAGTNIITQGEEGHTFYIVHSGTCDISVSGKGVVMVASTGVTFGELALLHNAPRAATVTAKDEVVVWVLDEVTFKMILMGKSQDDSSSYMGFLDSCPILGNMSVEEKREMAGCLKEQVFNEGTNIIVEGDPGNTFFLIRSGECKCTKVGSSAEVSDRLKTGAFFGELALLNNAPRAATVTAVETTTCLMLSRSEFTRLLGTLKPATY